jgi:hypothetical protein
MISFEAVRQAFAVSVPGSSGYLRLAEAERGELAVSLPIGYVRRPSGEAVVDPDEQAQAVVRLVFRPSVSWDHQRGAALPHQP